MQEDAAKRGKELKLKKKEPLFGRGSDGEAGEGRSHEGDVFGGRAGRRPQQQWFAEESPRAGREVP